MDTQSGLQQNKEKWHQGTQRCPQDHPQRRNPANNHWEFHRDNLDLVNQNVQEALKKFQDTKNVEYEKAQKQIKEHIRALNKH
jgi:hypothetical protein